MGYLELDMLVSLFILKKILSFPMGRSFSIILTTSFYDITEKSNSSVLGFDLTLQRIKN